MVLDDIVINKSAAIQKCLQRIRKYLQPDSQILLSDDIKQDAVILNLQRACENAIDLAMHLVRKKGLEVPQSSRDAFEILAEKELISRDLLARMKAMVGFRNIAIHEYQRVDPQIVLSVVRDRLSDFSDFVEAVKKA